MTMTSTRESFWARSNSRIASRRVAFHIHRHRRPSDVGRRTSARLPALLWPGPSIRICTVVPSSRPLRDSAVPRPATAGRRPSVCQRSSHPYRRPYSLASSWTRQLQASAHGIRAARNAVRQSNESNESNESHESHVSRAHKHGWRTTRLGAFFLSSGHFQIHVTFIY